MTTKFSTREVALIANTEVLAHIRSRNGELNKQAVEEGWEFWTLHGEDSADEYSNVYEYLKEGAIAFHSDAFKDINGFRPRHINYTRVLEHQADGSRRNVFRFVMILNEHSIQG